MGLIAKVWRGELSNQGGLGGEIWEVGSVARDWCPGRRVGGLDVGIGGVGSRIYTKTMLGVQSEIWDGGSLAARV